MRFMVLSFMLTSFVFTEMSTCLWAAFVSLGVAVRMPVTEVVVDSCLTKEYVP